jgi:hypothetical protein
MRRGAILALAISATTMVAAAPAAAQITQPPPNQPPTFGNCLAATAAVGQEGVEDYTIPPGRFTQVLKPPGSERPDVEYSIACHIFTPPGSNAPQYVGPGA